MNVFLSLKNVFLSSGNVLKKREQYIQGIYFFQYIVALVIQSLIFLGNSII